MDMQIRVHDLVARQPALIKETTLMLSLSSIMHREVAISLMPCVNVFAVLQQF
jgi:hypothetical protein